jgi:hypothetical protein
VSGSTITSPVTHGIVLGTGTYASPLTITGSGGVTATNAFDAIYGPPTQAWAIANYGTVLSTGTAAGHGIDLYLGGSVGNTGGLIEGSLGVFIKGAAGTVTNSGTIIGTGSNGAELDQGGSVTNTGGLIEGTKGIVFTGAAGTVTNSASIIGTSDDGVYSNAGGVVTSTGGLIEGTNGIVFTGVTGAVTNSASIIGTSSVGVYLNTGGSVGNTGTGLIQGANFGVYIKGAGGTLTNTGTVVGGTANGIDLLAGGLVINTGAGLIRGASFGVATGVSAFTTTVVNSGTVIGGTFNGVALDEGGTVIDSGTITGGHYAISFGGYGGNAQTDLLVLEQGYRLSGIVHGSGTAGATNTFELSGALGTVTATYNTLGLVNFQDVLFSGAGNQTLKITNNAVLPGTISGFTLTSDVVDLTQIGTNATLSNGGTVSGSHQLTIVGSGGTVTLQLDATDGAVFKATSDLGTGVDITPACFCRGTLILSDRGEVAVEDLMIGDRLVTVSGAARRVKWIGHRAYDGRFVAANRGVLPIRVAAGALAAGVPARDLLLSPEHALYLDGALVPAGQLVNGATIRQEKSVDRVEYFHIELEGHDVILAEGAPAETYVDCDNRFMFHNGAEFARLYPGDLPTPWDFCAPRAEAGSAELAAVRAALSERAAALGYELGDTADRHPSADGEILRAQPGAEDVHRFTRPAGARTLAVASGRMVPAEVKLAS